MQEKNQKRRFFQNGNIDKFVLMYLLNGLTRNKTELAES